MVVVVVCATAAAAAVVVAVAVVATADADAVAALLVFIVVAGFCVVWLILILHVALTGSLNGGGVGGYASWCGRRSAQRVG